MTSVTVRPSATTLLEKHPNLRLRDILDTLPRSVYEINPLKAWSRVLLSVAAVVGCYALLAIAPWYLLLPVWFLTGTALTGFFVIGHDCGHRSFSRKNWINNLVGHLAFLPLIYPFHSWRILHNHHHRYTNNMDEDNAWAPFTPELYDDSPAFIKAVYRAIRGKLWWLASVIHQLKLHFNWFQFTGKQREQVRFSALFVIIAGAIAFPVMFYTLGVWGVVKFWLMPWLGYHFWMSTFTLVHHTVPEIPFSYRDKWNEAIAQLSGTVHCDYPKWVEVLCHDINVHVPHHLSTGIPSYNLRKAYASIKQNWGEYLYETKFSWELMKVITEQCHLYDAEHNYISFAQHQKR
ncbi:fatty acid desaturase [Picosynechococcus sp. PCC 73109]|uniref:fatty acid desaturase n=1 Tax=Picosynechococcus sp. PCC 73109 TaxID=374982 RepID=UPI0007458EE5|nr:fatty acid desaturase [Picosynechococcus sp. PCC 73109]AMA10290.1 fatty acid desaturase [Picosynechococcus sp. PCC 73109]